MVMVLEPAAAAAEVADSCWEVAEEVDGDAEGGVVVASAVCVETAGAEVDAQPAAHPKIRARAKIAEVRTHPVRRLFVLFSTMTLFLTALSQADLERGRIA
jgi:hypothetical protein